MKNYLSTLQNCPLFAGITESDIETLMKCLSASNNHYNKNSIIWCEGDTVKFIGIVLIGAVHVLREDYWGKRKILTRVESGGLFGEAFVCSGVEELPISIMTAEESEILFIDYKRIMAPCSAACGFHAGLIRNLTLILARKNITLMQKLEYVTQSTTREKLLAYFSEQARLTGSNEFDIPFNREELADFLSVERSAMSAELSKMRKDGLVLYRKSHFELLE